MIGRRRADGSVARRVTRSRALRCVASARVVCAVAVFALAAFTGAAPTLVAQTSSRGARPRVLQAPASVVAAGMGDVGAVLTDADVLFYNPAMLPQASGVALTAHRLDGETRSGALSGVQAVGGLQVGVGARLLGTREVVQRVGIGFPPPDTAAATSAALTVGAGRALGPLRVGASATWAREAHDARFDDATFVDVGLTLPFGPGNALNVAAVMQHLGRTPEVGWGAGERPWRGVLAFGGRNYPLARFWDVSAMTQLLVDADGTVRLASGGELAWVPVEGVAVAVRAGSRSVDALDRLSAGPVTGGLGVTVDRWSLDWAVSSARHGRPAAHRVGVRVR